MSDGTPTPDQIAWLNEMATERRKKWAEHARLMTADERKRMEQETKAMDAEASKLLSNRPKRTRAPAPIPQHGEKP